MHTVIRDGVESFVKFDASPASDTVFDVSLSGVHGLRFVEGQLEFLDKTGAPRLRMAPPVAVDSAGIVADVTTTIEGCAYDDSPAGPWDRRVTAPGASTCAVHVSWSDAGLTYPVLLDPSWTTTGSMGTARRWHGAILLPTLKVLVIGGEGVSAAYLGSCELYDPSTGTWAATRALDQTRRRFTTVMVDGPKVLVAGGEIAGGRTASAALYNPSTGVWGPTGSMTSSRAYHDAVYLSSVSKVLVAGGMNSAGTVLSSAELYNPSAGTWTSTGSLATARQNATLTALADQTAIGIGGVDGASNVLASSEIYNPSSSTWSIGASLNTARHRHRAVRLSDGRVFLTGGFTNAGATTATAAGDLYDATLANFFVQDSVGSARADHGALAIPGNRVLVIGGSTGSSQLTDTQMYGANNATSVSNGALGTAVAQETATMMGTGYALVAGGTAPGGITNVATTSGPYFYVYDHAGGSHQLQFTSISGSWNTSFSFGLKYDSTAFNVVYDWIGGVGASLRATVTTAAGGALGTIVTAYKGNSTLTAPGGSPQVVEGRNVVRASDIAFLDDKTVIVGPERVMVTILDLIGQPVLLPPWFQWAITVRGDVNTMTGTAVQNVWNAIAAVTFDTSKTFHVRATYDANNQGGAILHQDCAISSCPDMNTDSPLCACGGTYPSCSYCQVGVQWNWFDIDVVRNHYTVNHMGYPQFFKHHRPFLDQMESWINGAYPGTLPFGHIPAWNPANIMPPQLQATNLPPHVCGQHDNNGDGTGGYVDSISICDWAASSTFGNPTYTSAFPLAICGQSDWDWFATDMHSQCPVTTGVAGWHGCVHLNIAGSGIYQGGFGSQDLTGSFGTFDAPASPLFFPWHAYIDTVYASRLDCP